MSDTREAILVRMLALAESMKGSGDVDHTARNQLKIDEDQLPAIIIIDGDELANESDPAMRPARAPRIVRMKPSVFILVDAKAADVGTKLNALRAAYLKAMAEDAELTALTHDNTGFRYDGCTAVVEDGRRVEGTMELHLTLTYILQPFGL